MNDEALVKPTRERMRKAVGHDELTEAQPGGVVKKSGAVRLWTQLENLYRNDRLTYEEYQAGQKFGADWWLGYEAGRSVTMRWKEYISGAGGDSGLDSVERRVFHSRRFEEANKLLDEMGVRKPLHWFIINDIPAEKIGRRAAKYRGQRAATASGVTMIVLGLRRLAKFYGIEK